ncbi:MAG: SOS response-associated peptidase [Gammaproteobacteria bacterium]
MCGRYTLRDSRAIQNEYGISIKESFNTAPGQEVLAITDKPTMMRWSYNPSWAKKPMNLINARSETLSEKPSYKMAQRCLIPADGWYEWLREGETKQPYFFHMNNNIFFFAGIYNEYQQENGCAIITKEANEKLKAIHHRMPVLLKYSEGREWLAGKNIYTSSLSERIEYYPVSTVVNSPKNNRPACIANLNPHSAADDCAEIKSKYQS